MNWIPGVSQVKSAFQLVCGDVEGAAKTQKDFFQECPLVSQVTSGVQLLTGDASGALETQKKCGGMLLRTADGIPVVGHVKGVIHYACGDTDGGNRAMKSATRTAGTMAAGAGGFLVGGPVGAIAAGIAGGAAFDTTVTVVNSTIHDEYRPSGYFAAMDNIVKNPNSGDIFDTLMMPVGDGLSGYSGGRLASRFQTKPSTSTGASSGGSPPSADALAKANVLEMQADALLDAAESGKANMPSGEYLRMANEAKSLWDKAQDMKGNTSPPVDLKAQPASSTPIPRIPVIEQEKNQEPTAQLVELWVVWETDTFPIIGIKKWEADLVSAVLHLDISKIEQICKEQNMEKLFDNLTSLTYKKVAQLLMETGAIKGKISENALEELLKKIGKKAKEAVKQYFTILKGEASRTKENDKRSRRGEHIINNGVLSLHRDIMNKFLAESGITRDGIGALTFQNIEDSRIMKDCLHYFSEIIRRDIQDTLKVHFEENELYVDANALLYGRSIELLRREAVQHMLELYHNPLNEGSRYSQPLRETIRSINLWVLYVDQHALTKWRQIHGGKGEATYERANVAVFRMFDGLYDRLGWWIREIRRRQ